MNKLRIARALCAFATICAAPFAANAGLLYEPGNYKAQDALLLHLDGIRNAGALKAHDNAATNWVNLANPARPAVFEFGSDASHWDSDGFFFGGLTCARIASMALAKTVTIEIVSDVDTNALVAARSPSTGTVTHRRWPHLIGAAATGDRFNLFYHTDASVRKLCLKSRNKNRFDLPDWEGKYTVGIIDNDKQVLVQNDAPNSATWKDTGTTADIGTYEWLVGSADVESGNGMQLRYLTGKIKAVRVYNRVLNDTEIAANRAIDEVRYFGALPATNAVVRTSVAGVEGVEPSGAYAVDADGHAFTAPATVTLGPDTYACAGCTVEEWDAAAGDWGEAVLHGGALAANVTSGDRKRITWLWTHTAGPGYRDVAAYAHDGLRLHLDGIRNAGADAPHDGAAETWADLANTGSAAFSHDGGDATSGWTADGYWFGGRSYATMSSTLDPGSRFTVQVVSDVDTNALKLAASAVSPAISWAALIGTSTADDYFNVFYQGASGVLRAKMGNVDIGKKSGASTRIGDWGGRYISAAVENGVRAAYFQTAVPVDNDWHPNFKFNKAIGARKIVVGSANGSSSAYRNRFLIGTVKAVRVYDRILADAELAANRELDDARFFGIPPATDAVIVATDTAGVEGDQPCGLYRPVSFAFTASKVETAEKDYEPAGYTVEEWDAAAGTWGTPVACEGGSCASPSGTGWPSRRITWRWTVSRGLRTAADYDVDDYVKENLVLHVDGIRNVGPDKPHGELLMLWRDLSSHAVSGNNVGVFTTSAADTARTWLSDGFYFGGGTYAGFVKKIAFADTATAQVVCDVDLDALRANGDTVKFPHFLSADSGDILNLFYHAYTSKSENYHRMCFNPNLVQAYVTDWDGRYFTGIRDGLTAKVFQTPRSDEGHTDTRSKTSGSPIGTRSLYLGTGLADKSLRWLTGTIHAVRVYDRALTDDELAQNRGVDEARFFGNLPVTNVVVAAGDYGTQAEAPGAYEVQGSWTFSATVATDAETGKRVRLAGYKLSAWDAATGDWAASAFVDEPTYTYVAGSSPDKVRLTWDWSPQAFVLVFR